MKQQASRALALALSLGLFAGAVEAREQHHPRSLSSDAAKVVQAGITGERAPEPTTYLVAEVVVDADPSDGDLELWGDATLFGEVDGSARLFWGEGGDDAVPFRSHNLELRFTGVMSEDGSEVVSGGSIATLGGVSGGSGGRDLDAHPFRPADAPATGPFLQRIPFEVWDVDDPANPRQLNVSFFDRGADGSREDESVAYHKTYNMPGRDYITVIHSDYDPNMIHQLGDANSTWLLFFTQGGASVWSTGDVFSITYANIASTSVEFSSWGTVKSRSR